MQTKAKMEQFQKVMKQNYIDPIKMQLQNQPNANQQIKEAENNLKKEISSMFRANDRMLSMVELKFELVKYYNYKT